MLKNQVIMFLLMVFIGICFNPMNVLANSFRDLYLSLTLFYGGLLMASNMIWGHEIYHYLAMGHFNVSIFFTGVILSIFISIFLLREQFLVSEKQWIKRMISHHSTAITTTEKLLQRDDLIKNKPELFRLAKDIVFNQKQEILLMKSLLDK